ncbi:cerebellin 20 [Paramormyrops kingsleyae]|uniref:cerebellin 20 n=1 Tax=Paramormyrops kingsleyae TaxID=1676925 RepID=UPI000CD651F0|nr:uncharacterized protein LOC111844016 [Paramormyrops kingsleyae]
MRGILLLSLLATALTENWNYTWNGPGHGDTADSNTENICLTDAASCGCCVMHRHMWKMERFFNLSLSELRKELETAQAALDGIRASRSAFSVALLDVRNCLGPLRQEVTIMYQSVFINLGESYNPATGIFTSPRSGVYNLAVTMYSDSGSAGALLAACGSLRVNGRELASLSERNDQDQEDSATVVLAVSLEAGDQVSVHLLPGCFLCDSKSHFNTFTGFLLYATD